MLFLGGMIDIKKKIIDDKIKNEKDKKEPLTFSDLSGNICKFAAEHKTTRRTACTL